MGTAAIIFISAVAGTLFGMLALGLCAASGREGLETENMFLRETCRKLKEERNTFEFELKKEREGIALEGTD